MTIRLTGPGIVDLMPDNPAQEILTLIAQQFPDETPRDVLRDLNRSFPATVPQADRYAAILVHLQGTPNPLLKPVTDKITPKDPAAPTSAEERTAKRRGEWFKNFVSAMVKRGLVSLNEAEDEDISELIIAAFISAVDAGVHLNPITMMPLDDEDMISAFLEDIDVRVETVLTEEEPDQVRRRELKRLRGLQTERERDDLEAERRAQMFEVATQAGLLEGADAGRIAEINQWLEEFIADVNVREFAGQRVDFDEELRAQVVEGPPGVLLSEADLIRTEAGRNRRAAALGFEDVGVPDAAETAAEVTAANQRQAGRFSEQKQAERVEAAESERQAGVRRSEQRALAVGKIAPPAPPGTGSRVAVPDAPISSQFAAFLKTKVGRRFTPEQVDLLAANEAALLDAFATAKEEREQERKETRESLVSFAASSPEAAASQAGSFGATPNRGPDVRPAAVVGSPLSFGAFLQAEAKTFLGRVETEEAARIARATAKPPQRGRPPFRTIHV